MAGQQQAQAEAASGSERDLVAPAVFAQLAGDGPRRAAYQELWTAHVRLDVENARLGVENGQLRQQVEELERRAGLHSRNSGKPPTTDGLAKLPVPKKELPQKRTSGQRRPSGRLLFCTLARSIWPHWAGGRLLPERNDPGQASLRSDASRAS